MNVADVFKIVVNFVITYKWYVLAGIATAVVLGVFLYFYPKVQKKTVYARYVGTREKTRSGGGGTTISISKNYVGDGYSGKVHNSPGWVDTTVYYVFDCPFGLYERREDETHTKLWKYDENKFGKLKFNDYRFSFTLCEDQEYAETRFGHQPSSMPGNIFEKIKDFFEDYIAQPLYHLIMALIFINFEAINNFLFCFEDAGVNEEVMFFAYVILFGFHAFKVYDRCDSDYDIDWWKLPLYLLGDLIAFLLLPYLFGVIKISRYDLSGITLLALIFAAASVIITVFYLLRTLFEWIRDKLWF